MSVDSVYLNIEISQFTDLNTLHDNINQLCLFWSNLDFVKHDKFKYPLIEN